MEKYKGRILLAIVCGFLLQMPSVNASDAGSSDYTAAAIALASSAVIAAGHYVTKSQNPCARRFRRLVGLDSKPTLHEAAQYNDIDVIRALLKTGADIDEADNHSQTPLYWAVMRGHADVIKLLVEFGADVNEAGNNGYTPLHWAAYAGHTDIVRLLIQTGADVNKANSGCTPLFWAAMKGHRNAAMELVARGAGLLTDRIKNLLLFQQRNPVLLRELEALEDQRLHAVRDWCNDLDHAENLPRAVIDQCIIPFALPEAHQRHLLVRQQ